MAEMDHEGQSLCRVDIPFAPLLERGRTYPVTVDGDWQISNHRHQSGTNQETPHTSECLWNEIANESETVVVVVVLVVAVVVVKVTCSAVSLFRSLQFPEVKICSKCESHKIRNVF